MRLSDVERRQRVVLSGDVEQYIIAAEFMQGAAAEFFDYIVAVAFARNMGEHQMPGAFAEQFGKRIDRVEVVQVADLTHDSPFQFKRTGGVAQHGKVVVGFDQQRVAVIQLFGGGARHAAEVGCNADSPAVAGDYEADWFHRVVVNRKTADREAAQQKIVSRRKQFELRRQFSAAAQIVGGARRDAQRNVQFVAENPSSLDMVVVFVGNQHGVYGGRFDGAQFKPPQQLAPGESGVDQQIQTAASDHKRISLASRTQNCNVEFFHDNK